MLAIDPGNPDIGAAMFVEGVLERAAWVKVQRLKDGTCPACRFKGACRHGIEPRIVTALCDELEQQMGFYGLPPGSSMIPESVVIELPLYFDTDLGGGGPIGKLLMVVGAIVDRAAAWGAAAYCYRPSEWKGTAKKEIHQELGLPRFSEQELALLPRVGRGSGWKFASDSLDAALLGAWWLSASGARGAPAPLSHFVLKDIKGRVQVDRKSSRSKTARRHAREK